MVYCDEVNDCRDMWGVVLKRAFDILVAGFLLVALSPVLVILGLMVRVRLGSPVLFTQNRPGRAGQLFLLYKFRTMTEVKDASGSMASDSERMTAFGAFLRATSADELPELWNVLKGDMSLVGPRPLLVEYLHRYSSEQARRHEVRPGITGLAQVSGRNDLTWEHRLALDVWYVDNQSLWLDFKILWVSVWKVLLREGVSSPGHVTMPEFTGSDVKGADSK